MSGAGRNVTIFAFALGIVFMFLGVWLPFVVGSFNAIFFIQENDARCIIQDAGSDAPDCGGVDEGQSSADSLDYGLAAPFALAVPCLGLMIFQSFAWGAVIFGQGGSSIPIAIVRIIIDLLQLVASAAFFIAIAGSFWNDADGCKGSMNTTGYVYCNNMNDLKFVMLLVGSGSFFLVAFFDIFGAVLTFTSSSSSSDSGRPDEKQPMLNAMADASDFVQSFITDTTAKRRGPSLVEQTLLGKQQ